MIEYHADDYGLFRVQSRHIMHCYHNGALNGISIMPNSPYLKECMDEIKEIQKKLFITVHLNFVEGKPLTGDKARRLTGKDGNFNIGFVKMLLMGYIPVVRRIYYKAVRREVEAQLLACEPYMNDGKFRIDGHVHYHMLPLVFDAMMDIIKKNDLKVSYIRFPKEELDIYRRSAGKIKDILPINVVKVLVLNTLARRNERKYANDLAKLELERKLFMGVMLSGHMFYDNVKEIMANGADIMVDRGLSDMEVLFHPGDVSEPEEVSQLTNSDDVHFFFEQKGNREKEAAALVTFGGGLKR
jgi:predicted glycoside hydrolase/deacetylase ChbG (UPF0249 family)